MFIQHILTEKLAAIFSYGVVIFCTPQDCRTTERAAFRHELSNNYDDCRRNTRKTRCAKISGVG